jgi:hypothetical protein
MLYLASICKYISAKAWIPYLNLLPLKAMGIITLYLASQPGSSLWSGITVNFGLPYFTISVGLNVILTLMISARLILHSRNIRGAMGSTPELARCTGPS